MNVEKIKQNWFVDGERVNLYQLYAVWLTDPKTKEKYGNVYPSQVTTEMVIEFASQVGYSLID